MLEVILKAKILTMNSLDQGEECLLAFNTKSRKNSNKILRAKLKIMEETYGYCDICGKKISFTMLWACPHTIVCSNCD